MANKQEVNDLENHVEPSLYAAYFDIDIDQALFHIFVLGITYLITLPVGIERSRTPHGIGLRTLTLVSVTCCAYTLIGQAMFESEEAVSKFFYGILTGVGFIGGGAVFKSKNGVHGAASAGAVWASASIGVAVGLAMLEIAIVVSLLTSGTLYVMRRPNKDSDFREQT